MMPDKQSIELYADPKTHCIWMNLPKILKAYIVIEFLPHIIKWGIYAMSIKQFSLKTLKHLPKPALCATLINSYPQGFTCLNAC
jgi:hypothetical protein